MPPYRRSYHIVNGILVNMPFIPKPCKANHLDVFTLDSLVYFHNGRRTLRLFCRPSRFPSSLFKRLSYHSTDKFQDKTLMNFFQTKFSYSFILCQAVKALSPSHMSHKHYSPVCFQKRRHMKIIKVIVNVFDNSYSATPPLDTD